MAEVAPIHGIHYKVSEIGSLDKVIGPPYDVLTPEDQDALYAKSPHNFVRIMLNKAEPGDNEANSTYTRAAQTMNMWLGDGTLVEDIDASYYIYEQEFNNPNTGDRLKRLGIFCGLKLEPYSEKVVLPHEQTRSKAKEDRLLLMRATSSNPEPIYCLFEDEQQTLTAKLQAIAVSTEPFLSATVNGEDHRVYRIHDAATVSEIRVFFESRQIWIADGHHRYETGLSYADERRSTGLYGPTELQPFDYLLVVLTAFNDPGIVVLPTHRLVKNISADRMSSFLDDLERYFAVELTPLGELPKSMFADVTTGVHQFGLVTADGAYTLKLKDTSAMDSEDHCDAWKALDVSILQTLILDRILGIPATDLATTPDIGYSRNYQEALDRVSSGEYQIGLILNDPSANEVRDVAAANDKMPPKSTFFYPKLWSGLILRKV
ncbi:MAG: DUF1015 domain-containing protein [Chthonomonadales bacterium]